MTGPADEAVPVSVIRALCHSLDALCDNTPDGTILASSVGYALARFAIPLPGLTATGTDRVWAAATGQAVVIGQYGDRSGWADFCYGPYGRDRAEAIAGLLTEGNWYSMQWLVIPVGVLPGGET